ncbi:MAG TPA: GNAT family N-acetyltransferase, partial [Blastocatellia bacterium]|nr:GNAT family N-acetyltransferase [Blastocatellia bacterium]
MTDCGESNFVIRPITTANEPFLWEMIYQAIYVPDGAEPPPREIIKKPEIARYVSGWGRDGDLGFLAVEATTARPVAAAWLRLMSAAAPGYGYIDDHTPELSVAVLPQYRGCGVGTRLLTCLLEESDSIYKAISLSV